ncbi:MAG: hypothetical protein AAGB51_11250 [Planctomycetota bacterium]
MRYTRVGALAVIAGLALGGTVRAQTVGIGVSGAAAAGGLGDPGNSVSTGTFAESFMARSLTWSGVLTSVPNAFFFEEDVFASIEGPNGLGYTGPIAGGQGIVLGSTPFSGWSSGFTPASVNGDWRFEAYTENTFPGSTDWTVDSASFNFNAALFPAAASVSIGTSLAAGITEGQILWYTIDHLGGAVEFSTAGSSISELDGAIQTDDTLIALFDSSGVLVASNDDAPGAGDFTSLLSFSSLASGEYHLAVTGSTLGTRVGSTFIATSHDGVGSVELQVAVPAPGAAVILLAAGPLASRSRRRSNLPA